MYTVITWLIVVVCIFLVITVLVQNAKGGGLAQNFAGQQQLMGVRKTTDFLEKATWTLMGVIAVLCIVCTVFFSHVRVASEQSALREQSGVSLPAMPENVSDAPVAPVTEGDSQE